MKLLIVTQKVDATDRNLGFFIGWMRKFSEHAEIVVIANEVGVHDSFPRVEVLSLGKEHGASRLARFFRYQRLLFRILPTVDGVFFHMCPEYVLGAHLLPALYGKKSLLWYVHKEVSVRLRFASFFVSKIFTASKESCRLGGDKIEVVGHGIDTDLFTPETIPRDKPRLVTVGRIAPVKDLTTIILGFVELLKKFPEAELSVIGEPITDVDRAYQSTLAGLSPKVRFGSLPYGDVFTSHAHNIFVHASRTGSLDKAVLETLSAGLPVFTSSEAFGAGLPGITKFAEGDPIDLAQKIAGAFLRGEIVSSEKAREFVHTNHSLTKLIQRIISFYG
ncbi:MAG: glycosyltransferase family 4 protein [bacterium]|nr:glycosyltransferase family 4 protein [bacterium]